ncbi:hypothetical protein [Streptomyces sp. NPDC005303]|uniref:hypothetical protein n=1 Tax=Streptomyces sp. NPDC005303 TaxID=3155713 RepID=UPI0033A4D657
MSTRSSIRTLGAKPGKGAASPATRTARARSPDAPSISRERRPKIVGDLFGA